MTQLIYSCKKYLTMRKIQIRLSVKHTGLLKFIEVSLQFLYLANSPMIQQSCRPQP